MNSQFKKPIRQATEVPERSVDELLRRALATPPISNEDILKRSKESHGKNQQS